MDPYEDDHEFGAERDLRPIEARLAAWRPSSSGLDRDRMLFEAGRAAARSGARLRVRATTGRLATAALLLVSIGLAFWTTLQGADLERERAARRALETRLLVLMRPVEQTIAHNKVQLTPAPIEPPAPGSYLALSQQIKRLGISDGLAFDDPRDDRPDRSPLPAPALAAPLRVRDFNRVSGL